MDCACRYLNGPHGPPPQSSVDPSDGRFGRGDGKWKQQRLPNPWELPGEGWLRSGCCNGRGTRPTEAKVGEAEAKRARRPSSLPGRGPGSPRCAGIALAAAVKGNAWPRTVPPSERSYELSDGFRPRFLLSAINPTRMTDCETGTHKPVSSSETPSCSPDSSRHRVPHHTVRSPNFVAVLPSEPRRSCNLLLLASPLLCQALALTLFSLFSPRSSSAIPCRKQRPHRLLRDDASPGRRVDGPFSVEWLRAGAPTPGTW